MFAGEYRCPSCDLFVYSIEAEVEMLEFMNRNREGIWRYEYEGEKHEIGVQMLVVRILEDESLADANEVIKGAFTLVLNSDRTVTVELVGK